MNNLFPMLINAARNGGNPLNIMQSIAGNDPRFAQFQQMIYGKSPQQLQQMAENLARNNGTTVEHVARSLGLR